MEALARFAPIVLLLVSVGIVLALLPRVDMGHGDAFRRRRILNWVPLGLTYAFLYFGRYNLSAIAAELDKAGSLSKADFNTVDGWGAVVYGVSFLLNGPLADRWGGRVTMALATGGSALANLGMAALVWTSHGGPVDVDALIACNAVNMYCQSFGAVSIVKVNAPWFHVRERGVLGGLFGVLISLGLYFSYDWSLLLARHVSVPSAFFVPATVLGLCMLVTVGWVRDAPSKAGFVDFDTGDASSGDAASLTTSQVLVRMFSQRAIWVIVGVEFCSGFLRQGVMKQYRLYAKAVGEGDSFVYDNWGVLLCMAGILGGVFAGFISDHVFGSRRGPVSGVLYGGLLAGAGLAVGTLGTPWLGWAVVFMSLCVIGVHGMLSGTASMDFGGTRNAGLVTGIIDGFVYLGTASQAFLYGALLPVGAAAADPASWRVWPGAMVPVAFVGLLMCTTIWNARPRGAH